MCVWNLWAYTYHCLKITILRHPGRTLDYWGLFLMGMRVLHQNK